MARTQTPTKARPAAAAARTAPSPRALLLALAAVALLPFLLLPHNPLILDAGHAITENRVVQHGSLGEVFTTDFWGAGAERTYGTNSYRPLVVLTYWAQVRLSGNASGPLRLFDMALHAGSAMLLALLLARLLPDPRWAIPGAALFAVHPAISEAVCCATGRADIMAVAALLGALVVHNEPSATGERRSRLRIASTVALVAAALLCKEYAVAFPFLLIVMDLALRRSGWISRADLRGRFAVWVGAGVALALYLLTRLALFGEVGGVPMISAADHPLYGATLTTRIAAALWLAAWSLRLLVFPWPLTYFYSFGTIAIPASLADPHALAGLAALGVLTALALARLLRRADPVPLIALAFFAFPLAPSLNVISMGGVLFAERFLYLPAAGLALALAWAAATFASGERARRAVLTACAAVVVVLAVTTFARVRDWSSAESITRAALEHYPEAPLTHYELGLALGGAGRHQEAVEALARAVELKGDRASVWKNYAAALSNVGRHADAVDAWRRCVALSPPDIGPLWYGLGRAELRAGNLAAAADALGRARDLLPQDPKLGEDLARVLLRLGSERLSAVRSAEAADLAHRAVAATDLPPEGLFQAGVLLVRAGESDGGRAVIDRALAKDPDLLRKLHSVAVEADEKGEHLQAAEMWRQILVARPDHAPTLFNLGNALLKAGRAAESIRYFEAGLDLMPDQRARALLDDARRRARGG